MSVRLFLTDNTTGEVHEYGTDKHDSLIVTEDGSLHYYNIQNGCGTMFPEEGYSFCREDGSVINPLLDDETLDIGGTPPAVHAHWQDVDEDENGPVCSHCKGDPESFFLTLPPFPSAIHYMNWKNPPKYCPHCGAVMDEEE